MNRTLLLSALLLVAACSAKAGNDCIDTKTTNCPTPSYSLIVPTNLTICLGDTAPALDITNTSTPGSIVTANTCYGTTTAPWVNYDLSIAPVAAVYDDGQGGPPIYTAGATDTSKAGNWTVTYAITGPSPGPGCASFSDTQYLSFSVECCACQSGSCTSGENPGTMQASLDSLRLRLSLGQPLYGKSIGAPYGAGALYVYAPVPSAQLSTPGALTLALDTNKTEVIRTTSGVVRQVRTPNILADILTNNPLSYLIRFYAPSSVGAKVSGVYTLSGAPLVVCGVLNPDSTGATSNQLWFYRTEVGTATTNVAKYKYDYLGQVTNGWKYDSGHNPQEQFAYFFDDIGNRRVTVTNSGQVSYTANLSNQYTNINGQTWTNDPDGNLLSGGGWTNTWDAENRLVTMTTNGQKLAFTYDWQGRRVRKQVWNNTAGSGSPILDQRFAYDGWNLIAILGSSLAVSNAFVWGLDLSGSLQGAGGVGGLLIEDTPGCAATNFPAFDGNGNVMALANAADSTLSAQYEYGPFGEVTRATGTMARANPLRFSTKYQDEETDLLYYGYRYYSASVGRWPNRDPLGESGFEIFRNKPASALGSGPNLYLFVQNDPNYHIDKCGLFTLWLCILVADRPFNPPGFNCITHQCFYICRSYDDPSKFTIKTQPKCYCFPCLKKNFFIDW